MNGSPHKQDGAPSRVVVLPKVRGVSSPNRDGSSSDSPWGHSLGGSQGFAPWRFSFTIHRSIYRLLFSTIPHPTTPLGSATGVGPCRCRDLWLLTQVLPEGVRGPPRNGGETRLSETLPKDSFGFPQLRLGVEWNVHRVLSRVTGYT